MSQRTLLATLSLVVCGSLAFAVDPQEPKRSPELVGVAEGLQLTLRELDPPADLRFTNQGTTLVATYLPQTFKIHGTTMSGAIDLEAHDEVGPSYKGFVLQVHLQKLGEINQAVTPQTIRRPYWSTDLDVTPLAGTKHQIYWALSYGSRTDKELLVRLRSKLKPLQE